MEFRLLGPVEAEADGRPLLLGGRRQRCVLTHLLLHRGTPVTSDWLIDQVWGDRAPGAVRASLHTYVSRLRGELGADRLRTRSQGYVLLATDDEVDVACFELQLASARAAAEEDPATASRAYEAALALPRGPALGDLADEPSLQPVAARLDGLVGAARRECVAVRVRLGQHTALIPELEELLRQDPLREDLWEHYLLALYRSGRQADALSGYSRLRASLRDELGIEPAPALARLHERLLRQDPSLALARSALRGYQALGVLGQGASAVVHRAVQPHTGREVALKSLHAWLADDPELVQRFAAEAQAALQLEHPHVLPLHDYWREPGGAFLALRLMRGGSLAQRLERGPLAAGTVVRLAEQVCRALEALPGGPADLPLGLADVLLDEHDNAYLSGFRLARRSASVGTGAVVDAPDGGAAAVGRLLTVLLERQPASPPAARVVAERAAAGGYPDGDAFCEALRACLLPSVPVPRAPDRSVPVRNPYKALRAFGEADADDFFGRSRLVERLVERLTAPAPCGPLRFLAVVGPSGSGKSSLVQAGLVPALRSQTVDGQAPWYVARLTPTADPLAELVRAVQDVAVVPPREGTVDRLRDGTSRFVDEVRELLPSDGGELLLVVDQFEELFTLVGEADRRAFTAVLVDAATAADSRVRVVVTLRADFYDRPLDDPALAELLREGTEVVVPLSAEELQQAVVGPSAGVGLRVEAALLAAVMVDAGDTSTSLPLLQYALTELADGRSGELTLAAYRQLGGLSGALVRRADATFLALDPEQQAVARQVLLELVHPDDSGADTRRRARQPELEQRTGRPAVARAVLTALGAARLVSFDRDPATRVPTVEVAHEALLREWTLLRGWLEVAREDLRTERRLATTAQEWEDTGRDSSFLATGSRLEALQRWAARWREGGGWTPTPLESAYLDAARAAQDRTRRQETDRVARERVLEQRSVRRLRVAAGLLAVAVVGVSTLTAYGFSQRNRAEHESVVAQARGLAAAAAASLAEDPERSVLLALEAVRLARQEETEVLPETEEALHAAVGASRVRLTVPDVGGAVDWSAQGLLVAEGLEDSGRVELRDGSTGEVSHSVPGHDVGVRGLAFSPDGRRLLTTGGDGAAKLWDPVTGRLMWEHRGAGDVWGPTFSGDGSRMAASWPDEDVVRVFDVADGRPAGEVALPAGSTALTHDGAWIVVPDHRGPGGARVLEVATGRLIRLVAPDRPAPDAIEVSPDGRWLVTAGADFTGRMWSVADGSWRGTLHATSTITDVDWSPDGSQVVVGAEDGVVRLFEVTDQGVREDLRLSSSVLRGVLGVAFSPDGEEVLLGDIDVHAAQVVDVSAGGSREWLTVAVPKDFVGADFTDDGATVAASAAGGGLVLRDVASGRVVLTAGAGRGLVSEVATSPDRSLVAGSLAGELVVWDSRSGEEVFSVFAQEPRGLTWSRDSTMLGFVTEDSLPHLVDRTGKHTAAPPGAGRVDDVTALALTPDGGRVVTSHRTRDRDGGGTGRVLVYDRVARSLLAEWPATGNGLAVSPDGRRVAVAVAGGDVVLHDLATGSRVLSLVGHATTVRDLQFSSDGRRLVTAGQDGTVRLWSTSTGDQQLVLRGHRSAVLSARLSTDGTRLVSASGDGTLRVWALDLDDLVELAEQRTTRGLTADECRRYLQRSCG